MASADLRLLLVLCTVSVSSSKLLKETEDGGLQCVTEGRYLHPDNCDQYVDCIPSGDGRSLQAYPGSCRGGVFNPDVKKCLAPSKDTNCTVRERRPRAIPMDSDYDFMCSDMKSGFFCLSCKSLVNCVNGRAYVDDCGAGHTCDMRDTFGGGVCYPGSPEVCQCRNRRELLPDPYSPQAYLECKAETLEPNVEFCKKGMTFMTEALMCEYPVDYVECTKHGIFPNPKDCTEYYKCMPVTQGLIQYTFSCTCGLFFNDLTGKCEDPCEYQPQEFICEAEGRYPDEYDCHKFYLCINDSSAESGFHQSHRTCPEQSFWKSGNVEGTGSCQITRGTHECTNFQMPKCGVPAGRNCTTTLSVTPGGECIQGSSYCQCNSATGELSCQEGYSGDGETCQVSDGLCGSVYCVQNAACNNGTCVCETGFSGDGVTVRTAIGDSGGLDGLAFN